MISSLCGFRSIERLWRETIHLGYFHFTNIKTFDFKQFTAMWRERRVELFKNLLNGENLATKRWNSIIVQKSYKKRFCERNSETTWVESVYSVIKIIMWTNDSAQTEREQKCLYVPSSLHLKTYRNVIIEVTDWHKKAFCKFRSNICFLET